MNLRTNEAQASLQPVNKTDFKLNGILYIFFAQLIWGIMPIYWKTLKQFAPMEILAHRILWSFVFVALMVIGTGEIKKIKEKISNRKQLLGLFLGGTLIGLNWFIYTWAVNNNKIVEMSLGFFINPICIIFFGLIFFKERLDFWQILAVVLAFLGISLMTIRYGQAPWIALALALIFSLYSVVKKLSQVDALIGLALESFAVAPIALTYLIYRHLGAHSSMEITLELWPLIIVSGVITSVPLYLYARGTKLLPMSTLGFLQYLSPSLNLLIGIFIYKEAFSLADLGNYSLIWLGLLIYTYSRTGFIGLIRKKTI